MSETHKYLRGAFIAWEPGGYPNDANKKRVIPFRFNPEALSRSLSIEQAEGGAGTEGANGRPSSGSGEQSADSSTGTLKESFSLMIRLDVFDRHEASQDLDSELGVLPEISALEDLLYAVETDADQAADGQEPVAPRRPRPTVLFVWGRKRVFPVKVTGMTINELLHNAALNPVRAEVEVAVEVVGEADARDNQAILESSRALDQNRRRMAKLFLDNTANQATDVPQP